MILIGLSVCVGNLARPTPRGGPLTATPPFPLRDRAPTGPCQGVVGREKYDAAATPTVASLASPPPPAVHLSSLSGNVLERLVEEHLLEHVARARRLARGDERREAELGEAHLLD